MNKRKLNKHKARIRATHKEDLDSAQRKTRAVLNARQSLRAGEKKRLQSVLDFSELLPDMLPDGLRRMK
jgi:hypothetical protein